MFLNIFLGFGMCGLGPKRFPRYGFYGLKIGQETLEDSKIWFGISRISASQEGI